MANPISDITHLVKQASYSVDKRRITEDAFMQIRNIGECNGQNACLHVFRVRLMFQPVNDYLPEAKGDFRDNIVHGYPAAVSLALFDFFDRAEHIVVGTGIQLVPGS
ncbi:hypothetical protein D3C85_1062130 [compost metagenome]